MFAITLSSDIKSKTCVQRGLKRYVELFSGLIGLPLSSSEYEYGPMSVYALHNQEAIHPPLVVQDKKSCIFAIGRPSSLKSEQATFEELMKKSLNEQAPVNFLVKKGQGDFVILWLDMQSNQWEISSDSLGLGRLYLLSKDNLFILSDSLYLLAACLPLTYDHLACYMLDLHGYMFGPKTIFENVQLIEMGEKVSGDLSSWNITNGFHFIDDQHDSTPEDVAQAYLDAAEPRLTGRNSTRLCMTGGTDSRVVLSLLSYLQIAPDIFCNRWDIEDTQLAHQLANELRLNFMSVGKAFPIGITTEASKKPLYSWMAERILLDGSLIGAFTNRNYVAGLGPNAQVLKGSYGEGTIKSTWGFAYAGSINKSPNALIERVVLSSPVRQNFSLHAPKIPNAREQVNEYLREVLRFQAKKVPNVHPAKLANYLYLRNRGARWAAQGLQSSNRLVCMELPLAYQKGVSATWGLLPEEYRDIRLVRYLMNAYDVRCARYPFNDGRPSALKLETLSALKMKLAFLGKGWNHFIWKGVLGQQVKKEKGNLRPSAPTTSSPVFEHQLTPLVFLDNKTSASLLPYHLDLNTIRGGGHLEMVLTLLFAANVYDGQIFF